AKAAAKAAAKSKTRRKPASFDDYVGALAPDKRDAVQQLRAAILSVAPTAEECISYDLPAFRIDGKVIAWIGAASSHIAMYGVTGLSREDLAEYDTSGKGTLRFPVGRPLPLPLVHRIVQARIARNNARR
ncbi:MAG: DUF1801 domain-containing protein, partial [Gemmatimonadota bacterium]